MLKELQEGNIQHHPAIKEIVDVLCNKTQNKERVFFNIEVAYFLSMVASNMRTKLLTKDRGEIPVNMYAIALATSGFGKGHSVAIMENDILSKFRRKFVDITFEEIASASMRVRAERRSLDRDTDFQEEYETLQREFIQAGEFPFTFDSGTVPAVKQLRHKLLLAGCGAINLRIDEIGSNLLESTELLNAYLELYDQGTIKPKLTKNTQENIRAKEIEGKTPTNMLLFGTPAKLLDGSKVEDHFYSMLSTGYARRCIFAMALTEDNQAIHLSPEEVYRNLTSTTNNLTIEKWSDKLEALADLGNFNKTIIVPDDVGIKLTEYHLNCKKAALALAEHEEIQKAEITHRYFKALKLAGAFAFIDGEEVLSMKNLLSAIYLVEESGKSFSNILIREKAYMKVAKYIASTKGEVTHADLVEALPFYKSGNQARTEMMTMAKAWGYGNNILIKNRFVDGIEFFRGETLERTSLEKMYLTVSESPAYDYMPEVASFEDLPLLFESDGFNWCNHRFVNNHRREENVIPGFNMLVLDVDDGTPIHLVKEAFKDYTFIIHTTKRHTEEHNRYRMIIPLDYTIKLEETEYKLFVHNFMDWFPFALEIDGSATQRSRKWSTCKNATTIVNNTGLLVEATMFIPQTTKNEQFRRDLKEVQNLDNLERWFVSRMVEGDRNNTLIKYGLLLVDANWQYNDVIESVRALNSKINNGLPEDELNATIFKSIARKYSS